MAANPLILCRFAEGGWSLSQRHWPLGESRVQHGQVAKTLDLETFWKLRAYFKRGVSLICGCLSGGRYYKDIAQLLEKYKEIIGQGIFS